MNQEVVHTGNKTDDDDETLPEAKKSHDDDAAVRYAVVTGCSPSSIGFLAAKTLATSPHRYRVVLACRDPKKGKLAEDSVRRAVADEHEDEAGSKRMEDGGERDGSRSVSTSVAAAADVTLSVRYRHLDLSSMESIRNFVEELETMDGGAVRDRCGLSLLINNAGVGWAPRTPYIRTKDGLEEIVGVNHFGHFALTIKLLKHLKKASDVFADDKYGDSLPARECYGVGVEPRVVVLSSSLHDPDSRKRRVKKKTEALHVKTDIGDTNKKKAEALHNNTDIGDTNNEGDSKSVNSSHLDGDDRDDGDDASPAAPLPQPPQLLLPDFPNGILQDNDRTYNGGKAYRVSKLCNIWFVHELQRRLDLMMDSDDDDEGEGTEPQKKRNESATTTSTVSRRIKVVSVSPGFIPSTGLTRRSGIVGGVFLRYILDPLRHIGLGITRSPEEGARAIVEAATSPSDSIVGGEYFWLPKAAASSSVPVANASQAPSSSVACSIESIRSSDESCDEEKAKTLWDMSIKICHLEEEKYNLAAF